MFNTRYNVLTNNNPINDILSSYPPAHIRPFSLQWLNSAHLESLLPGSNWEKICDVIIPEFCEKINSQFANETRKQALFEVLGKNFVSKYFPFDTVDVTITKPPFLSTEESIRIYEESTSYINVTMNRILKDKSIYDKNGKIASDDMKSYMVQAENIFTDHFQKELAKKEAEHYKAISTNKRNFRQATKSLNHKPQTAVSSVYDKDLPDYVESIYPYGPEMLIAPPPHCSSYQSEFIGSALSSICQHDEQIILKIVKTMSGRRLPMSLRKCIWKNVLLQTESPIYDENINFEELNKEKFSRVVTRGIVELKINQEMLTPVNELLEHLIIEQYERCLPLNKFGTEFQSEAVKILNILYLYDRSYERHLMFWLFPLHYGLREDADTLHMNKTPFAYEMAMYLNLLRNLYPVWPDIFDISKHVILRLCSWNGDFVNHLLEVAQKNVMSQNKEFLAQIMDLEKKNSKEKKSPRILSIAAIGVKKKIKNLSGPDLIKSPIIFIRKWIGEAFVSILKNEAVLYIFDQLFMENFSPFVFEDACLAIMLLLSNEFSKAQDHEMMKKVFLKSPSDLLTLDIVRAWTWIHRGGNLTSVPAMNRRETYPSPVISSPVVSRPSTVQLIILPDLSVTEIRLKLVMSLLSDENRIFAKHIKPESLFVTMTMCSEDVNLRELKTQNQPYLKLELINDDNTLTNTYRFPPEEKILFHVLDVTRLKNTFKDGDSFYLLITVQYQTDSDKVITLGWCTCKCFLEEDFEAPKLTSSQLMRPSTEREESKLQEYVSRLKVKRIRHEIPLFVGNVPESIINFKLDENVPGFLMNGSMLGLYTYDPLLGTPTPPPRTPEIIVEEIPPPKPAAAPPPVAPTKKSQPPGTRRIRDDSWVPHNPKIYDTIAPSLTNKTEPFCIYIDQVRFLPDTATIIKVTGRFVQSGNDGAIPDILLFPDVETLPRSPIFRANTRVVVNKDRRLILQNSTLLVLRVYTVLKTTLEIVVIGDCIVPLFDIQEGVLLAGCYQKRLRADYGLVDNNNLASTSLNRAPYIDAVSITLRLWPLTENPIQAPDYKQGFYQSADCEPTDFEWDAFELYNKDKVVPTDLREVVRDIKLRDANLEFKDEPVTHNFMRQFIPYRLDLEKHLSEDQPLRYIQPELMFHYRIEKGIHIKVDQVFGLEADMLLFATVKVLRGSKTAFTEPRPGKRYGIDELIIYSDLDPNQSMRSSKWNNPFQLSKPYYDDKALLVVQVWGISAVLKDKEFYDKKTGQKITKLTKENLVGWTAIQLFKNGFVNTGKHQMPLYQNRIHFALLKRFQTLSIASVLQAEEEFKDLDGDSIVVYVLDAHKNVEDYPTGLPLYTEIIDALPEKKEAYIQAMNATGQGSKVYEEISELTNNMMIDENIDENKYTIFNKMFQELAKKLTASIPPKQPYMPIFV